MPTLAAGQGVQFSIFTTVLRGVELNNTACLSATNLSEQRCATGRVVRELPATGETPWWADVVRGGLLIGLASMSLVGLLASRKGRAKAADHLS